LVGDHLAGGDQLGDVHVLLLVRWGATALCISAASLRKHRSGVSWPWTGRTVCLVARGAEHSHGAPTEPGTPTAERARPATSGSDQWVDDPASARVDNADEAPPAVGRVLRRARQHAGLTLREVERRTGRANAYLSQVERGVIRRPDPLVLLELAELYGIDFLTLARWAGLDSAEEQPSAGAYIDESLKTLVRLVLQLDAAQRTEVLSYVEHLLRRSRT
jgi:transcriptional regulator with XRE-family HTH domain